MENSAAGSERRSSAPTLNDLHLPQAAHLPRPGELIRPGAAPLKGMRRTSRIHSMNTVAETKRAPALNITCRLDNEHEVLSRLALLITGDIQAAELSVFKARELLTSSASPYRLGKPLTEWHKRVTIEAAISASLQEIARYESRYVYLNCTHSEHLVNGNDSKLGHFCNLLQHIDLDTVFRELDPLARAVAILRTTGRASILDCVSRLRLSVETVLAANCRAMAWLAEKRTALSDKARTSQQKLENL